MTKIDFAHLLFCHKNQMGVYFEIVNVWQFTYFLYINRVLQQRRSNTRCPSSRWMAAFRRSRLLWQRQQSFCNRPSEGAHQIQSSPGMKDSFCQTQGLLHIMSVVMQCIWNKTKHREYASRLCDIYSTSTKG